MKGLKDYNIDIFGLSNSTHQFDFQFNNEFFHHFEHSIIKIGSGISKIELVKTDSMITTSYDISGTIELICDRSNDPFNYSIEISEKVIYKFGIEEKELSDNVFVILKDTQRLNIAELLYQFITLSIPMKKLHPRYINEAFEDEIIYQSELKDDDETIDPRWEALKKLK